MTLPTPYSKIKPIGTYIPEQKITTPGAVVPVIGGQSYVAPGTVSTTPGYVQWNQTPPAPINPVVAPSKNAQPAVISNPPTPTTPITPSVTTAQTVNDLWLRQGETIPQYQSRTGMSTGATNIPTDGSIASLGALSPDQLAEMNAYGTLANQGLADSTATFNTAGEQTKYTNIYQDRINSINALYNDMIAQSRANNAPVYAAREQQARLNALQSGLSSSPMGQAQITNTQNQNMTDQQKLDAALALQQRQELQSVYDRVDTQVANAQARFDQAKAEGGKTYAEAIKNKNAVRKSILNETLSNVVGKTISDADINTLATKLGLSPEYVRNEFDKKNKEYRSAQTKATAEAAKTAAETASKTAETAKTIAETAQVGKMTPYQAQQIAIDWYKAKNPAGKATDQKAESFGKVVSLLSPEVQSDGTYKSAVIPNSGGVPFVAQGYLTPEGWKEAVRVAASEGIKREDLLTQVRDKFSPDNLKNYGLTASDIKIINGELPQSK